MIPFINFRSLDMNPGDPYPELSKRFPVIKKLFDVQGIVVDEEAVAAAIVAPLAAL